ncbi:adenine phosphoribosyltransferase [Carbonactinospora thermoautotrophica]|uniref:Adenine phosphoribosyltransferase n=1 Tax=Carbonactinospora thermoautotrophica TaxID=1469144 RepID=A0A132NAQ0_9ACTN|nr:adenine phosphoribosyltransferase [Carbonactinospora thermoautotrophica]KWX00662.1 Adenine phosphoribosyltransferase [Carbonactinospora thermoautotrophica]KWX05339.1 adenine phosphoribosyltransferase [Carbonactinospora thermoautotrophica]KWX07076.1 adenine phosphoribosyltransferase [Carbonactinospora thermoautotrophica]MCX9193052.1 adenine phosphoribosyltransferase [Carbonactinospora thermoautotrophica]
MTKRQAELTELLKERIRDIPDYPKPGILFKDITPLLADQATFGMAVSALAARYQASGARAGDADQGAVTVDKVVGIEARGFILAAPVAYRLGAGFVPVRKKGKLPYHTHETTYDLEYGTATLEVHQDAFTPGDRVLIVDDVLATGGTVRATIDLVERAEAQVVGIAILLELAFLQGRDRFSGHDLHVLLTV